MLSHLTSCVKNARNITIIVNTFIITSSKVEVQLELSNAGEYPDISNCAKVSLENHKAIHKNLESGHIKKQHIIECEDFD